MTYLALECGFSLRRNKPWDMLVLIGMYGGRSTNSAHRRILWYTLWEITRAESVPRVRRPVSKFDITLMLIWHLIGRRLPT